MSYAEDCRKKGCVRCLIWCIGNQPSWKEKVFVDGMVMKDYVHRSIPRSRSSSLQFTVSAHELGSFHIEQAPHGPNRTYLIRHGNGELCTLGLWQCQDRIFLARMADTTSILGSFTRSKVSEVDGKQWSTFAILSVGYKNVSVSLRDGDARRLISSQVTSVMSARSYHRRQRVDAVMKEEDIGQSEWEHRGFTDRRSSDLLFWRIKS